MNVYVGILKRFSIALELCTSTYHLLQAYPNQELVTFFLQGVTEGFWISYDYTL